MMRLYRNNRAVAAIEFAFVAPVLFLLILGGLEIGHTLYVDSILIGAVQKAGRDMSLEDGATNLTTIEGRVTSALQQVVHLDTNPTFTIKSYHDYTNAASPAEEFGDTDHDGVCDHGETYVDSNGNNQWDADGSVAGRGGAKDVVLFTASVTYNRLPIGRFITSNPTITLTASTLLRNQPSNQQSQPLTGICP